MSETRWTEADVAAHMARRQTGPLPIIPTNPDAPELRAKYGNKKTLCEGILFDSGHEADRYLELKALEGLGEIRDLELQPRYGIFGCELSSGRGIEVASFKADFRYFDLAQNRTRIEDAKSDATKGETAYRLRKKLVEVCHGITIEEI